MHKLKCDFALTNMFVSQVVARNPALRGSYLKMECWDCFQWKVAVGFRERVDGHDVKHNMKNGAAARPACSSYVSIDHFNLGMDDLLYNVRGA